VNGRRLVVASAGLGAFGVLARHARGGEVGALEEQVFRGINALPQAAEGPLWVVMQTGSLAAVGVAAGAMALSGHRETAVRLGVAGSSVWALCKVVKSRIGRGRPGAHLQNVIVRGAAQSGLGFPSGHTAVAFTLAGVASPVLSRRASGLAWTAAGLVAVARQYVGAHLPADVAGGVAIGLVATAVAAQS
jgi:membrane-associated phospholipid phosphatase